MIFQQLYGIVELLPQSNFRTLQNTQAYLALVSGNHWSTSWLCKSPFSGYVTQMETYSI
jgi:hypothetical protein